MRSIALSNCMHHSSQDMIASASAFMADSLLLMMGLSSLIMRLLMIATATLSSSASSCIFSVSRSICMRNNRDGHTLLLRRSAGCTGSTYEQPYNLGLIGQQI